MPLLQGFDSFSCGARAPVVQASAPPPPESRQHCRFYIAETAADVLECLQADPAQAIAQAALGTDADAELVRGLKLRHGSVVLIVHACHVRVHRSGAVKLPAPVLDALTSPPAWAEFVARHGDAFVSEIAVGGDCVALFHLQARTPEAKAMLLAWLASVDLFSGLDLTADVNAEARLAAWLGACDWPVDVRVRQRGYRDRPLPEASAVGAAALVARLREIAETVADAPVELGWRVTPCDRLLPDGEPWATLQRNRQRLLGRGADPAWSRWACELTRVGNACEELRDLVSAYGLTPDAELDAALARVQADQQRLQADLAALAAHPLVEASPQRPASLALGWPRITVKVEPAGSPVGGRGGTVFGDAAESTVYRRQRITRIAQRGSGMCDALILSYRGADGSERRIRHGGEGGAVVGTLELADGEVITSVRAWPCRYGNLDMVLRVDVQTSRGRTLLDKKPDPAGSTGWAVQPGQTLVGFAGSCGGGLDSVVPLVLSFGAVVWTDASPH